MPTFLRHKTNGRVFEWTPILAKSAEVEAFDVSTDDAPVAQPVAVVVESAEVKAEEPAVTVTVTLDTEFSQPKPKAQRKRAKSADVFGAE